MGLKGMGGGGGGGWQHLCQKQKRWRPRHLEPLVDRVHVRVVDVDLVHQGPFEALALSKLLYLGVCPGLLEHELVAAQREAEAARGYDETR